ncbi:Hint domain-containing protein [Limibacter armeniacum]|uniref:NADase-type glycan-binding domain-containing protein n=1 Tax=Limibacter armeniacum TaxID=466084 RepID=UPI002FE54FC5
MKYLIFGLLMLGSLFTHAQTLRELNSYTIQHYSEEGLQKYKVAEAAFTKAYGEEGTGVESLTEEEKELLNNFSEVQESYFDPVGGGCSWYCGGGPFSVTASSFLTAQGKNTYVPDNAHDLDLETAWVEGVDGYGIGEYLLYHFKATSPRITQIIVGNGYLKSEAAWRNNSRVKTLKMYVDDKPYALLHLKDERSSQGFRISPLGKITDGADRDKLREEPDWTIKFEIVDVYKGDKYDDVVISEIYFDGIDVHCFAAGTRIKMADGSEQNIEDLSVGDKVISFDQKTGEMMPATIQKLASPYHKHLVKIQFSNGSTLTCTEDHPLLSAKGEWLSVNPQKTQGDYQFDQVALLKAGDAVRTEAGTTTVINIQKENKMQKTYTIVELDKHNAFIANGIVVGTEQPKSSPSREQ